MTHDELHLINLARQGDRAAYGRLVGAYQRLVFAVALNVTGHWGDSEDAVQEAFLRAWLALRSLADPARFAAWLCTITRNAALEILRRNRRLPLTDLDQTPARALPVDTATPAEAYARRQLAEILWAEVAELPARTREAILLFYVEEYSIRRAAEFLGISEAAFKMRLQYGRERLRETLATKLAEELHRRKPGEGRRQTIEAALPLLPALAGLPGAGSGGGSGLAGLLAAWSAKQVTVVIGATLLAGAALTGAIYYKLHAHATHPAFDTTSASVRTLAAQLIPPAAPNATTATQAHAAQPAATPTPTPAAYYPLRGRILFFETGATVPNVTPVLDEGWPTQARARKSAQGGWEFASVAAGRHTLHFREEDCTDRFVHPEGGITLDLWVEQPVEDLRVFVHPPSGVSGRVTDEDGRPITGARVGPYGLDWVTCDAQGFYRITNPHYEPGRFQVVRCEAPGYFNAESEQAQIYYGHVFEGLDLTLISRAQAGVIAGRVVDRQGRPVPLMPIRLDAVNHPGIRRTLSFHADLMTDAEGRFRYEGVPPVTVRVAVEPISVHTLQFQEEIVTRGAKLEGLELKIDRELDAGGISGKLVKRDGTPVAGEILFATPPGYRGSGPPGSVLGSTRSGPDGGFLIPGLKPGNRVDLVLEGRNLLWNEWPVTVMGGLRVPMQGVQVFYPTEEPGTVRVMKIQTPAPGVRPARVFEAIGKEDSTPGAMGYSLLTLASSPCLAADQSGYMRVGNTFMHSQTILEGEVVDASGAPLPDAEIIFPGYGTQRLSTHSDARGAFLLRRAFSVKQLEVTLPGYRVKAMPALPPPQRRGEDVVIRNFKIVMERGDPRRPGSVTGAVINAQGHPSLDVSVRLTPISTPRGGNRANTYAHTDKEGLFTFKDVPSGKYQIVAGTDRKEITVQEGKASAVILQDTDEKH